MKVAYKIHRQTKITYFMSYLKLWIGQSYKDQEISHFPWVSKNLSDNFFVRFFSELFI